MLKQYYKLMHQSNGHRKWWPGRTRIEIIMGAILTQNTNWFNVVKALNNLKRARALNVQTLQAVEVERLAEWIRPSGYYRMKAERIKCFMRFLDREYKLSLGRMFRQELQVLRPQLLAVKGIGPETADCILLYAGKYPIFVVDAYTRRIYERHGVLEKDQDYESIREYFEANLPKKQELFNDYHAQIVYTGHHYCKKSLPQCQPCPLRSTLKGSQPILTLRNFN